jgi:DNA-binding CsgD family transcriptional regulator
MGRMKEIVMMVEEGFSDWEIAELTGISLEVIIGLNTNKIRQKMEEE